MLLKRVHQMFTQIMAVNEVTLKANTENFFQHFPNFKSYCCKNTSEWLPPVNLKQKQKIINLIASYARFYY